MQCPVDDLEILGGIFNIDQSARTHLHVEPVWRNQFSFLAFPEIASYREIPGLPTVHKPMTMLCCGRAQLLIPGDPSEFDQGLTFEWFGVTCGTVVRAKFFE